MPSLREHGEASKFEISLQICSRKATADVSRSQRLTFNVIMKDSCTDVQHKKRGRPRLRDVTRHNFDSRIEHRVSMQGDLTVSTPNSAPPPHPPYGSLAGPHRAGRTSCSARNSPYSLQGARLDHAGKSYFDDKTE